MKKKLISMLLALTLVVTGIPSNITVNAAEATDAVESTQTQAGELQPGADNLYAFNVSENGKAIGSDGVVYDDVAYLLADTVRALDTDAQDAYFEFCDDIASARSRGNALEDVVAAVDENGELVFHYSIPVKELVTAMDALSGDFMEEVPTAPQTQEKETEAAEQTVAGENAQTQETAVKEEPQTEDESGEDGEQDATQETVSEEASDKETASDKESVSDKEPVSEEAASEETIPEEVTTETDFAEESVPAEESTVPDEDATEVISAQETETVTEEETESVPESFVLTEENMELIPEYEEEHFSVAENVKADLILDLGYNNSTIQQANSILPKADWFRNQLNDEQKKIFDASKVMAKGTNKFRLTASNKLVFDDFCQAISAVIMTEPYKCDWMDISGTGVLDIRYRRNSQTTYDFEVTVGKSRYYNDTLNKDANAKVLQLAKAAQEYALKNYPDYPVYGIVKYFDNWICENNFYNEIGVTGGSSTDRNVQEIYFYCHSSYGILLKGSGVCESYALAMTRLLDAVGIPNMYATGDAGGGHAWNYVQMPNGNWYLQDSTWDDNGPNGESTEDYFLCADDGIHIPKGNRYVAYTKDFDFVERSTTAYKPEKETEQLALSQTELNLLPKKTAELTVLSTGNNAYWANEQIEKVWSSSNPKVAKVDQNGKVTAVSAGSAEITLTAGIMSAKCIVNVHQINSITFENGGKTSLTTSLGIESDKSGHETQHIWLNVNQKAADPMYTAEELQTFFNDFSVKSSNEAVAKISESTGLSGNRIDLAIEPVAMGKATITVTFGTKSATLKLSVSEKLNESWFQLENYQESVDYTGKTYRPKVVLTPEGKAKKVKYRVTYKNNKDAGIASVVITGTGSYGGELVYEFTINPLVLNADTSAIRSTSKAYNGGVNPAKVTVRHINGKNRKVSLKAGKDYDIEYTNTATNETTTQPVEAGIYTMEVVGKGNYEGSAVIDKSKTYTITPVDIRKVKVTVKVNGTKPAVTVAIGKNVLPETDYVMTFYQDKKCTQEVDENSLASRKQYFVKVEGTGSNLTNQKPIVKSFKTR